MARVTVCLFFLAIFQFGILKSSAEETTEGELKNNEETTTKPTEGESAKEAPSKAETEDKSKVTTKTEPKDDKVKEEKGEKSNDSKKDSPITQITAGGDPTKLLPDMVKGVQGVAENNQTKVLFDVPKTILAPVNAVGAKVKEIVEKSIDTAKDFASGTFNFFKTAMNSPFQNNQ